MAPGGANCISHSLLAPQMRAKHMQTGWLHDTILAHGGMGFNHPTLNTDLSTNTEGGAHVKPGTVVSQLNQVTFILLGSPNPRDMLVCLVPRSRLLRVILQVN